VRKWDMATCVCLAVFAGHEERINRLISTGDFIFSSSVDATIRCWDLEDGRCIREFAGHLNSVFPMMYIPIDDDDDYDLDGRNTDDVFRADDTASTDDLQRTPTTLSEHRRP